MLFWFRREDEGLPVVRDWVRGFDRYPHRAGSPDWDRMGYESRHRKRAGSLIRRPVG